VFVRTLASLRPDVCVYTASNDIDVSFGAVSLIDPSLAPTNKLNRIMPLKNDISSYADRWRERVL
jgi:hypothetical protein